MAEEQKKTVKKAPAKKAPAKKAAAKKAETPVEEATPVATEAPKKAPAKKAVKAEKKAPKVEEPVKPAVTEAKAFARDVRVTPRKVRLVVDLVRGKDVKDALGILAVTNKAAVAPVEKLIRSAAANAVNNFHMDGNKLYIADQGPDAVVVSTPISIPAPKADAGASGSAPATADGVSAAILAASLAAGLVVLVRKKH